MSIFLLNVKGFLDTSYVKVSKKRQRITRKTSKKTSFIFIENIYLCKIVSFVLATILLREVRKLEYYDELFHHHRFCLKGKMVVQRENGVGKEQKKWDKLVYNFRRK